MGNEVVDTVEIAGKPVAVWPADQKLKTLGDRSIVATRFADIADYHPGLAAALFAAAADERRLRRYYRFSGGSKIYHLEQWGVPEVALIDARARALFRRVLASDTAVVDLSWANIYRRGDYAMAHSHDRSTASIVYFLDLGDDNPRDQIGGRFAFVDPRLPGCCKAEGERVTTPMLPRLVAGDMILFPGAIVHAVNPYDGKRPRLTLSWNINKQAVPGPPLPFAD